MTDDDDLLLEALLPLPASRLRARREQIDAAVARLQFEGEYVDRALGAKESMPASPVGHPAARRPTDKVKRRGSKRDVILAVMRTDPDRVWLPSEVRDRLSADQNIDMTRAAVRVAMKRMVDDDELQRPDEGANGFKLASLNGSSPEADSGFSEIRDGEPPLTATRPEEGNQE